jgi:uncharacterized protein (TIGR00297 family)
MIALLWGAGLAALIAIAARRVRALSPDGAVAAFVVGTIIFGAGGLRAALVLLAFFVPSSLLTRVGRDRKRAVLGEESPTARNAWQVLANGGVAALCAAGAFVWGGPFAAAFAGAIAAASADTWATELGTLSRRPPISIMTFRPVPTGFSGGITPLGTAASVAGALSVAIVAWLLRLAPLPAVATAGVAGALLDSLVGASLQARNWCPACARESESSLHHCGTRTIPRRGIAWLQNDGVNVTATLCGALVAAALAR